MFSLGNRIPVAISIATLPTKENLKRDLDILKSLFGYGLRNSQNKDFAYKTAKKNNLKHSLGVLLTNLIETSTSLRPSQSLETYQKITGFQVELGT